AEVYAFEPSAPKMDELSKIQNSRLHTFACGLAEKETFGTLEWWYARWGGDGFEVTDDCRTQVYFTTIDAVAKARFDYLKIDVEGGELEVLQGGIESLKKWHPTIVIENHEQVIRTGPWMQEHGIVGKIYTLLRE